MSSAYADETVPADLRMLIADYLITEFWPGEVGAERDHAQNTYNEASDHALGGFNRNMQQLLDLAWEKEELVEQVLYFCKAKLDGDLIHEVERLQEERAARDESDEKEEGQPQVRDIRAALMQAQEEHAAGTLSPEREDAILSIFGPDFFSAGGGEDRAVLETTIVTYGGTLCPDWPEEVSMRRVPGGTAHRG